MRFHEDTIKGFLDFSDKVSKIYFLESGVQARQGSMSHLKQEKVREEKGEKEKHVKMKKRLKTKEIYLTCTVCPRQQHNPVQRSYFNFCFAKCVCN